MVSSFDSENSSSQFLNNSDSINEHDSNGERNIESNLQIALSQNTLSKVNDALDDDDDKSIVEKKWITPKCEEKEKM